MFVVNHCINLIILFIKKSLIDSRGYYQLSDQGHLDGTANDHYYLESNNSVNGEEKDLAILNICLLWVRILLLHLINRTRLRKLNCLLL